MVRKFKSASSLLKSQFTANSLLLLYHRIEDAEKGMDPFNLCVSPGNFESQLKVIRELGNPVSLLDFVKRQREGSLEKGSICLTVDDGYLDILENALPLLEKYEIPVALYCVSGNLGQSFWWDELNSLLHQADELPTTITFSDWDFSTSDLNRLEILQKIYQSLTKLDPANIREHMAALYSQVNFERDVSIPRLMNRDELKRFSQHPLVTIGAHTRSHLPLSSLSGKEQLNEIESSVTTLTDIIGKPVETFSYPFGLWKRDFDETTVEMVRNAGLDHALAADKGVVNRGSDPFRLKRIWIHNRSGGNFSRLLRLWL